MLSEGESRGARKNSKMSCCLHIMKFCMYTQEGVTNPMIFRPNLKKKKILIMEIIGGMPMGKECEKLLKPLPLQVHLCERSVGKEP